MTIPVVDLSNFIDESTSSSRDLIATVRDACETLGFFHVVGHEVPEALIDRMYQQSRRFFDLAPEIKRVTRATGSVMGGLMYSPLEAESLASPIEDPLKLNRCFDRTLKAKKTRFGQHSTQALDSLRL